MFCARYFHLHLTVLTSVFPTCTSLCVSLTLCSYLSPFHCFTSNRSPPQAHSFNYVIFPSSLHSFPQVGFYHLHFIVFPKVFINFSSPFANKHFPTVTLPSLFPTSTASSFQQVFPPPVHWFTLGFSPLQLTILPSYFSPTFHCFT